ncbi:MAG: type II secretion system protein GspE [Bdellovibrionales bacterium CG12_big_fil_rev_8_21_14_0_65_38_15]|nr:MAG: type II secretion system protein GspE [Bdellovibrionales bacterium CG22_combo_CG10-13_8_21_14_all_38_13]PIQ57495.1 MAG: type II secretion system protein GspE [Bdellovibrionales bacterium CG12_big_fil_rev_8_21_14_0_65_38_15]PIR31215.1 MAG: type II secretion system protein GspE [Bdellovibrionales bacterium CG11_big_fil_rev_8_21_14_0_20_38_13]
MMVGQILLKKNYIHPHDIVKVICHQIEIPYLVDLKIDEINPELVNDLPINYAKQHEVLPFLETDYTLQVLVTDPFNPDIFNDLQEIFKKEIVPIVTSPLKIQDAINRVYEKANRNIVDSLEDEFDENLDLDGPIDILDAGADEAPVIRFVNSIIFRAVKEKASDIHVEPYEKEVAYRFRINGIMSEILRQPLKTQAAVSSRIKVMAKLDIAEKRLPQDGRIKIKMAGKDIDIRLSTVPVQNGERIVMRILEKSANILELEKLGFHGKVLKQLDELSKRKHGVLYVSGPTGSGKTTTLSAILSRINDPEKMIITVEDPVEYEIGGISQIQVNSKIDLTFARALRSIVRQDPDVIMVGETRDGETAHMAIEASLTGHFVLSTIHTNDAASAPNRLIDMGVQPFLIASSLAGILAQRLVQTLCPDCKEVHDITKEELKALAVGQVPPNATIFKAVGCPKCNFRGYAGRSVISELLIVSDEIRPLILEKADASTLKKLAMSLGMKTLKEDAFFKVCTGVTSVDEMVRVVNQDEMTEEN